MLELRGTESLTIEVSGTISLTALTPLLTASGLPPERAAPEARVSLLLFQMKGLHQRGLPWPAFNYGEALWRIAVHYQGQPAWLAVACDLDSPWIRFSGARLVRYPVRRARFDFSVSEAVRCVQVTGPAGELLVAASAGSTAPPPEPPRPLLVYSGARLYRIPWREEPAPFRRVASIDTLTGTLVEPTFGGPVRWDNTGLVHHGRIHRCGLAQRA